MANMALFGTQFEDVEDKDSKLPSAQAPPLLWSETAVSRRPTPVHEQIATDENGKRRFHGAFTGGFSAGYWNTVGSKEGWTPSTFKSTRKHRADAGLNRPEDFMDDEDLGEFGIAPRQIRAKQDFADAATGSGASEHVFAWERAFSDAPAAAGDQSSSGRLAQSLGLLDDSSKLGELVRPVTDSFGTRLLKRMGWRPGKGVGPSKQRQTDMPDDIVDGVASFAFAPEDTILETFSHKTNSQGLGYTGLQRTSVLDEKYGKRSDGYRESSTAKRAIRGQAFGVGAFEEEDEDVYTTHDLSQYDHTLPVAGTSAEQSSTFTGVTDQMGALSASFTPAAVHSRTNVRRHFAPPKLPRDYKPTAVTTAPMALRPRDKIKSSSERAHTLRNNDDEPLPIAVYLKEADSKRLKKLAAQTKKKDDVQYGHYGLSKPAVKKEEPKCEPSKPEFKEPTAPRAIINPLTLPFANDTAKMTRFNEYVACGRRGVVAAQPVGMTEWAWETECKMFSLFMPDDVKNIQAALNEQRDAQPLAPVHVSAQFQHLLASKFTVSQMGDDDAKRATEDEDKVQAVRMGMFGPVTRQSFEWHPHALLCRRMNVPEPYPGSNSVGVPNATRKRHEAHMTNASTDLQTALGAKQLPSTELEIEERRRRERKAERERDRTDMEAAIKEESKAHLNVKEEPFKDVIQPQTDEPLPSVPRPPVDLFKAVFASSDDEVDSDVSVDEEPPPPSPPKLSAVIDTAPLPLVGLRATLARVIGPEALMPLPTDDDSVTLEQIGYDEEPESKEATNVTPYEVAEVLNNRCPFGPSLPPPAVAQPPKSEPIHVDSSSASNDDDDLAVVFEKPKPAPVKKPEMRGERHKAVEFMQRDTSIQRTKQHAVPSRRDDKSTDHKHKKKKHKKADGKSSKKKSKRSSSVEVLSSD